MTLHIKQLFGAEKSAKVKGLAKLKQRLYKRFGKQIIASKNAWQNNWNADPVN